MESGARESVTLCIAGSRAKRLLSLCALVLSLLAAAPGAAADAFNPSPHAIDIPQWFKTSFLDFREDIAESSRQGKRLVAYFGQDGCPYCRELMRANFSQKDIADKARKNFDIVAFNIWGDREVVWLDRSKYTEKSFSALMKVQFTPTLLFFDEQGKVVLRLNGYYPPHKFAAALDYVAGRHESRTAFAAYLAENAREQASGRLHDESFFMRAPHDLARSRKGARPLAVFFEQKECAACDELHGRTLKRKSMLPLFRKFDIARLELFGQGRVVTPDARQSTEERWARELNVAYTPSIIFFDGQGNEILRVEGYVRPFHLESSFAYVASGAYRKEPSFQRYIQRRAESIRQAGGKVEIW